MERIYRKPIDEKIEEIKKAPSNGIFLVGEEGSGKTTILLDYVKQSEKTNNSVIDLTLLSNYSFNIPSNYEEYAKLYQVCVVILKMLLYIKENYPKIYKQNFLMFNVRLNNILNDIVNMYNWNKYEITNTSISNLILKSPEVLINDFLNIINNSLSYESLTVIFDNFDVVMPGFYFCQTYLYNMLKKYLKVVATISTSSVISDKNKLDELAKSNTLINVNYSFDLKIVKKVLNEHFRGNIYSNLICLNINCLFSDDLINKIILKTNGNLFIMIKAIEIFLIHLDEINPSVYENYLLYVLDNELDSKNGILADRKRERKFYL